MKEKEENISEHLTKQEQIYELKITKGYVPIRIDVLLTQKMENVTRAKVQSAIADGRVTIGGKPMLKPSRKVMPGDEIVCRFLRYPPITLIPQDIPLDIRYEDDDLLVVNKPSGMCTHPGVGNRDSTLVNALLWHLGHRKEIDVELGDDEEIDNENEEILYKTEKIRPGIVHRLDKNTSGLLVIAKTDEAMQGLQSQFIDRTISREYYALVWGIMKEANGRYDSLIGRSPRNRKHFAVLRSGGKHAITNYWVIKQFPIASLLKIKLETGRTHQIRVHLSDDNHSIIGDVSYGGDENPMKRVAKIKKSTAEKCLKIADSQMLHARELSFIHPKTRQRMSVDCDLPDDMKEIIELLSTLENDSEK